MQWIAMLFPAFVSIVVSETVEKKKYTGVEVIKYAGVYALFSNMISLMIYQYILKTPTSFLTNFEDNLFLIHYTIINLFFAVALPIIKLALNPHMHLRVERRNTKDEDKITNEKES